MFGGEPGVWRSPSAAPSTRDAPARPARGRHPAPRPLPEPGEGIHWCCTLPPQQPSGLSTGLRGTSDIITRPQPSVPCSKSSWLFIAFKYPVATVRPALSSQDLSCRTISHFESYHLFVFYLIATYALLAGLFLSNVAVGHVSNSRRAPALVYPPRLLCRIPRSSRRPKDDLLANPSPD